jgi:WD40 repeat protein
MQLYWNTIRANPLKVYHEFAFAPRSSIFQQIYSKSTSFPHPIVTIGLPEDWTSHKVIHTYTIQSSCLSPTEDTLATGGKRENLPVFSLWNLHTTDNKTLVHPCGTNECFVAHVSFDVHGAQLRTGCGCGKLCKWDISTNLNFQSVETMPGIKGFCRWWSDDGSKVVSERPREPSDHSSLTDHYYDIWLVGSSVLKCVEEIEHTQTMWIFSPGSGDKVINLDNTSLTLFECSSGEQLSKHSYTDFITCIQFSPDSTVIVLSISVQPVHFLSSTTASQSIHLLSSTTGQVIWAQEWMKETRILQFLPNGEGIVVGNRCDLCIIRPSDGSIQYQGASDESVVNHKILVSSDSKRIAKLSNKGIEIFNTALDTVLERYLSDLHPVSCHHLSWNHSTLISITSVFPFPIAISFFFLSQPPTLATRDRSMDVSGFTLSPDGRRLLTSQRDGSLILWDAESGNIVIDIPGISDISKGSRYIEFAQDSSLVLVWNSAYFLVLEAIKGYIICGSLPIRESKSGPLNLPPPKILACTFFPLSHRVLALQSDGALCSISINDSVTSVVQYLSPDDFTTVLFLAISPTEQLVAVACKKEMLITNFAQIVYRKALASNHFWWARFSPDGKRLYTMVLQGGRYLISYIDISELSVSHLYSDWSRNLQDTTFMSIHSTGGDWFSLIFPIGYSNSGFQALFLDAQDGKPIIASTLYPLSVRLLYGNSSYPSFAHHCIAYQNRGEVIVVNFSLIISQM